MDNASLLREAIDNQSIIALAQQASTHFTWICLSPISILTNILVILTIVYTKDLHGTSHFVIISHSVGEISYSLGFFIVGICRYIPYLNHVPYTASQLVCIIRQIPANLGAGATQVFAAAIAFDRLFCVGLPVRYAQLIVGKYIFILNVICWSYALAMTLVQFLNSDTEKLFPVCNAAVISNPTSRLVGGVAVNSLLAVTVIVYVLGALILFVRYRKANLIGEVQMNEWRRQMDFAVFMSMAVIGLIYILTFLSPNILTAVITFSDSSVLLVTNTTLITSTSTLISEMSHLFVYLCINHRFRQSFVKLIFRKDNSVVPFHN